MIATVPGKLITALLFVGVFVGSFYGWGSLVRKLAGSVPKRPATTTALGMGAFLFLGSLLNIAGFASGSALDLLLLIGLIVASANLRIGGAWPNVLPQKVTSALGALLVLTAFTFIALTQFPPAAHNFHDDLQKYFAHPVRMLATGTLFGSSLSALGSETLGGQALLQAPIAHHLGVEYVNGLDALAAFVLCLLLLLSPSRRSNARLRFTGFLAVALIWVINPQYVNVSALYTGCALMITALFLAADPQELEGEAPSPWLLGLIYAGLASLKSTFALFGVLHLTTLVIVGACILGNPWYSLRWGARVAGWWGLFLAPWLILHGPHLSQWLFHYVAAENSIQLSAVAPASSLDETLSLFSTKPLFYGGTSAAYSLVAVFTLLTGLLAARCLRGYTIAEQQGIVGSIAAGVTGFFAYLTLVPILGPQLAGYNTGFRYAAPFLIAVFPAVIVLVAHQPAHCPSPLWRQTRDILLPVACVIVILAFSGFWVTRLQQASRFNSVLAFSRLATNSRYIQYNDYAINGPMLVSLEKAQALTPKGETILAWVNAPFHLDFARNRIVDIEPAGAANPWATVPPARYLLIDYNGYATRSRKQLMSMATGVGTHERFIGERTIELLRVLEDRFGRSKSLYDDGTIKLLQVE